ncbi:hypothetical protein J4E80_008008 [Alternaria sp. BMP 0032]|nr:hypothetical protein J4E80_008008 [Alternaria sp. BMP 0032]
MSDSTETPHTPKKASLNNTRLEIPRPVFQRETTAVDPSEWQAYTPKTSHGFIAMHTSTPEDMHENRSNGKPTPAKDYFSVPKQKHNPILSPNPAPYEPHGFLPLCSVAAVEVDATDYFGPSDRTVKSDTGGANCAVPGMAKDVECDDAPQFDGHVNTSRRSLGWVAHPSGEHSERDVPPKPEEEKDVEKEPEIRLRGGSGEELCDGDKETVDLPPEDYDEIKPVSTEMSAANMDETTLPETEKPSPVIRRKLRKNWKRLAPLEGHTGRLFDTMQHTDNKTLIALKSGFTVDIVNADTKKPYVRNIPLRMLWHFCGASVLDRFIPDRDGRPDQLKIPVEEAEKAGVARVIRYMRRACKAASVRPTGELRVPPSLAAGIETIRACRVFGLHADADRLEDVIIDEWIGNEAWYMTDEHVELIWDGYHGKVQDKSHPLAEEIRWMLEQDEYETLKARVMEELGEGGADAQGGGAY